MIALTLSMCRIPVVSLINYIASEKFIHDELRAKSMSILEQMGSKWIKNRERRTVVTGWSGKTFKSDDGAGGKEVCLLDLKARPVDKELLKRFCERIEAYGFLIVRNEKDRMEAILETKKDVDGWIVEPEYKAGIYIPNIRKTEVDGFGLLTVQKPVLLR